VDDCRIVDKDFNRILSCVLKFTSERGMDYYHKLTHKGYLRHLLIRKAAKTGEILIDILTTTQADCCNADKSRAEEITSTEQLISVKQLTGTEQTTGEEQVTGAERVAGTEETAGTVQITGAKRNAVKAGDVFNELAYELLSLPLEGKVAGILHTFNDSQADVVQNDSTQILYGRDYIFEELLGLRFKISAFSFFQTNSLGAEVLYSLVRQYVGETKDRTIFDLYSGTGTIAQLLAPVAKKVTGVEIVEEAVAAAKENAALNGLTNCEFIAGDVLKVVDSLTDKPDIIVLDPPRDGIHPKALEKIIAFGVDRIVYISCKPTSLQRDLEVLQTKGYKVEKICAVDMFPETVHVETCCLLYKVK
jgi:tRNA/tmRNA/rRNA uracil-C5-methylase (TrmA/RlmC/RlmD family)